MEKNVEPLTVKCAWCDGTGTKDAKTCEPCTGSGKRRIRMDAYYYGFGLTGVAEIDVLLSAVACAGKAFHHTDSWGDECSPYHERHRGNSPVDWIQNAAEDAAAKLNAAEQDNKRLREALAGCLSMLEGLDPEEAVAPQQMQKARSALKTGEQAEPAAKK